MASSKQMLEAFSRAYHAKLKFLQAQGELLKAKLGYALSCGTLWKGVDIYRSAKVGRVKKVSKSKVVQVSSTVVSSDTV